MYAESAVARDEGGSPEVCAVPLDRWLGQVSGLQNSFAKAWPFSHVVLDDFLPEGVARQLSAEFVEYDLSRWYSGNHLFSQIHRGAYSLGGDGTLLPVTKTVIDTLQSSAFVSFLERLSGISGLCPDRSLFNQALHMSGRGDFVSLHVDSTEHRYNRGWRRRINLLLYLNEGWRDEYGGHLELWDPAMRDRIRILPQFNRCLIFRVDGESLHGFPDPITCPEGMTRKAVALWYYTNEAQRFPSLPDRYRARPGDPLGTRLAFLLDYGLGRSYRTIHRFLERLGVRLDDRSVSRVLGSLIRSRVHEERASIRHSQ